MTNGKSYRFAVLAVSGPVQISQFRQAYCVIVAKLPRSDFIDFAPFCASAIPSGTSFSSSQDAPDKRQEVGLVGGRLASF